MNRFMIRIKITDHWFGMNGMISNPYKYQAMVLGNASHAFSFHAKSIKIPALIS